MRGTRWLLLVAIAAIIFGVGVIYQKQKKIIIATARPAPPPLPENISSTTFKQRWVTKDHKTGCMNYELTSEGMRQASDSSRSELSGVELHIFHKSAEQCDTKFDLVRSDAATFFDAENRLYGEGPVKITLGEPTEGEPPPNLVAIDSSGVTFDTSTGKADSDRFTKFHFKNGEGESTGASYDPESKVVFMKNNVKVDWNAATPHSKPLHIEAPSLRYEEKAAVIELIPNGKMTRDELTFEGEAPIIHLQTDDQGHKFVQEIDAAHAHGSDMTPGKQLKYAADRVWVFYNGDHVIERIVVEGNADMTSTSATSETQVTANHVEMYFNPQGKESDLDHVVCQGHAVVNSKPITVAGKLPADSHVLRAENIDLKMRSGGKEIQTVSAHPTGTLEFLPNQPASHHRTLKGDDMLIAYAPQNRIETFHATKVTTTTDPSADELKPGPDGKAKKRPSSTTASKELLARFEPQSSQLSFLEQTGSFNYQEGDRKAHAEKATLDQKQNVMTLDGDASVSDSTGTTTAQHVRLDQKTDDFLAEGNVKSTRLPDKDQKGSSSMLSGDAPTNAQARKMESNNRAGSHRTRYEGDAKVWQGANRISANVVEIDRDKHSIVADGNVVTEAWEQPKEDSKKKSTGPVLTKVFAPHMIYTDQDKLAYYSGGVKLERPDIHLKSKELHAWLADSKADSQLEKAFADGAVEISGARRDNNYNGTSEHMEYYTTEQKVILNGGAPQLVRSVAGQPPLTLKQRELIYFVNDGKLVGEGAAIDRIPPKKK